VRSALPLLLLGLESLHQSKRTPTAAGESEQPEVARADDAVERGRSSTSPVSSKRSSADDDADGDLHRLDLALRQEVHAILGERFGSRLAQLHSQATRERISEGLSAPLPDEDGGFAPAPAEELEAGVRRLSSRSDAALADLRRTSEAARAIVEQARQDAVTRVKETDPKESAPASSIRAQIDWLSPREDRVLNDKTSPPLDRSTSNLSASGPTNVEGLEASRSAPPERRPSVRLKAQRLSRARSWRKLESRCSGDPDGAAVWRGPAASELSEVSLDEAAKNLLYGQPHDAAEAAAASDLPRR